MEVIYRAGIDPHLAELAHHFREASVTEKAIEYSIRAGQDHRPSQGPCLPAKQLGGRARPDGASSLFGPIPCGAQEDLDLAAVACANYREIDDWALSAFADCVPQLLQIACTLGVNSDNGVV